MKTLIKTSRFSKIGISSFIGRMRGILQGMESYPLDFPNPEPPLNDFRAAIQTLVDLAAQASRGDRDIIISKNNQRELVSEMAIKLSCYVMLVSDGGTDTAKIQRAGFEIAAPKAHAAGSLQAPHLRSQSKRFSIALSWNVIPGAAGYQVMMSKSKNAFDPSAVFELASVTTRANVIINNISAGEVRSFIVYAFGASAKSQASNIVTNVAGM